MHPDYINIHFSGVKVYLVLMQSDLANNLSENENVTFAALYNCVGTQPVGWH